MQLVLRKKKKTPPRAQTKPDASFGPVFVMVALPVAYLVIKIYKTSFSI